MPTVPAKLAFGIALTTALSPRAVSAQFTVIENLFKSFTDIGVYGTFNNPEPSWTSPASVPRSPMSGRGVGIELSFTVGELQIQREGGAQPRDTTVFKPTRLELTRGAGRSVDTVWVLTAETRTLPGDHRDLGTLELAVGYTQVDFETLIADSTGVAEVRGAVRELPQVSLYWSIPFVPGYLSPYVAVRTGLVQLSGLRVFAEDGSSVKGSGQALELGGVVGLVLGHPSLPVFPFLEGAYTRQAIGAVQWDSAVPQGTPRSLDFTGWRVAVGAQVFIGKHN